MDNDSIINSLISLKSDEKYRDFIASLVPTIYKEKIIGVINDLLNTNMLHREIAEKWNISTEMVQGINTGRYWYQENKNYPL